MPTPHPYEKGFFPGHASGRREQASVLATRRNSPTTRIRSTLQLPFQASVLSSVVRRRVFASIRASSACRLQGTTHVGASADGLGAVCVYAELAGRRGWKRPRIFPGA